MEHTEKGYTTRIIYILMCVTTLMMETESVSKTLDFVNLMRLAAQENLIEFTFFLTVRQPSQPLTVTFKISLALPSVTGETGRT